MTDDRTKSERTHTNLPDGSLGDDLRDFLGDPAPARKSPRTRNLRPTFRSVPGTIAAHGLDRRALGSTLSPARAGVNTASTPAPGADDSQRRRAAILEAGRDSGAIRPAQPADASPAGGGLRGRGTEGARTTADSVGRRGSGEASQKQIEAGGEGATRHITHPLSVGIRVSITDPTHPWTGHSGEIVSGQEKYGLGWWGQRLKLDGNAGECFVRPGQTDGTAKGKKQAEGKKQAGPPRSVALPADIKKLVPKSDDAPSTSKIVPTETERADARKLFREIGQRFNENRKKSKTAAYAGFRHDLMDNLDTLVMGGAIDLKEATTIITNLEQYTRETEQESTETPATILGRWLRMDAAEVAALVVEEVVEDEEKESELTEWTEEDESAASVAEDEKV